MTTNKLSDAILADLLAASTTGQVEIILSRLPIVDPSDYQLGYDSRPIGAWKEGYLHWLPVGMERGNGGRIKLAGQPTNPIAERLVNGMEAIIELARLRELRSNPKAPAPQNPREAVLRYFGLPRLDAIPRITDKIQHQKLIEQINQVRQRLSVRLLFDKQAREFAVTVQDEGMGQEPSRIHQSLLSLGQTDKADKPYMIGVFGQGGSSAFAASEVSIILSRRSPDLISPTGSDGIGWSVVRQIIPKGRRDPYFAYLAASPDGKVPTASATAANNAGFTHGTRFTHIKYDFGSSGSAITRLLYQALNHVLFNPLLPYDLFTIDKQRPELMQGTAQRLARQVAHLGPRPQSALDKSFLSQPVGGTV